MPLVIRGNGPVAGTLNPGIPLADRIAAIPNLAGGWFAEDAPVGAVASWSARYGSGVLAQSIAGRTPTRATGSDQVVGQVAGSLAGPSGFTTGGEATVGLRLNFTEPAVDLQYLFGFVGGSTFAAVYRSASGSMILDATTDIPVPISVGWHEVILIQTTTTTSFRIGPLVFTAANAGIGGNQIMLFNRSNGGTSNGFRGGMSRILISRSALPEGSQHYNSMLAMLRA